MTHDRTHPPVSIAGRLTFAFVWWILIARIIVGIAHGTLWPVDTWIDARSWLYAFGFAVIGTVTYWARIRREG